MHTLLLSRYSKLLDKLLAYRPRRSAKDYSEIIKNSSTCTYTKLVFLSAVERYNLVFLITGLEVTLIATNSTTSNSSGLMMVLIIIKDKLQLSNNCIGQVSQPDCSCSRKILYNRGEDANFSCRLRKQLMSAILLQEFLRPTSVALAPMIHDRPASMSTIGIYTYYVCFILQFQKALANWMTADSISMNWESSTHCAALLLPRMEFQKKASCKFEIHDSYNAGIFKIRPDRRNQHVLVVAAYLGTLCDSSTIHSKFIFVENFRLMKNSWISPHTVLYRMMLGIRAGQVLPGVRTPNLKGSKLQYYCM